MGWEDISLRERDRLLDLRYTYIQTSDQALWQSLVWEAQRYGMKYDTLVRRLQEMAKDRRHLIVPPEEDQRPSWQGYLRADMQDCLFLSDLEVPDHNEELLYYAREVARVYSINNIIWAGDINAQDEPGLSTHENIWDEQRPTFQQSILTTKQIFNEFSFVPHQYFISGNHDNRLARATAGSAWFAMLFPEYANRITFSRYSYMYVTSPRGLINVTHPHGRGAFSENAINVGRNIINASKHKCHVIMAHTHQGQRGHSKDGQYEIIALGCLRCPIKTQYKNIVTTTFGEWQPGFAMMKDGYFYMMNQYTTNWKAVLDGYAVA